MPKKILSLKSCLLTFFCLISLSGHAQEKLIFAIDLTRHGDRTALTDLPNSSYHFKEGLGQLTQEGMYQAFQLGQKLRKNYIINNDLLPPYYHASALYVTSTNVDRTIMTAQSLLMGLYPTSEKRDNKKALPHQFQPIPIHTVDSDVFDAAITKSLLKRYVYSRPDWQLKLKGAAAKFPNWSKATGIDIKDETKLGSLADTLNVYFIHHIPLPQDLSLDDAQEIVALGMYGFKTSYEPKVIGDATGKKLVAQIANDLRNRISNKITYRVMIYSAHDSNLLSVMSRMGVPLNKVPHYASHLNFSLYEDKENIEENKNANYKVKITYNDTPVKLPDCKNMVCTLDEFLKMAAS